MADGTDREMMTIAGRDVAVSNPRKVLFPQAGYTKLDVARYYVAVADGALRGAGGRPNVLVRYPNGSAAVFLSETGADIAARLIDVVTLSFPSGRTAEKWCREIGGARMDRQSCARAPPAPGRADDLDHPDELRVDLDPVPGIAWSQLREVARVVRRTLEDFGLVGWPKTSGSRGIHVYVRIERRWTFP
jgi:DNA primase